MEEELDIVVADVLLEEKARGALKPNIDSDGERCRINLVPPPFRDEQHISWKKLNNSCGGDCSLKRLC
jgi:hypothetical protein